MSTAQATDYWRERDTTFGAGWADHYWRTRMASYRLELASDLAAIARARSFFEVGCNVGANLWHLSEQRLAIGGCDVNAAAIAFAQEQLNGDLRIGGMLDVLGSYRAGGWDVVFSCYALAYLAPEDLPRAIRLMMRVARRAIVLAEPMHLDGGSGYTRLNQIPEYKHDFVGALKAFGVPRSRYSIRRIEAPDHLNAILTLEVA